MDKGWGILAHHVPRQKLKMAWTKAAPPSMARKIWWEENQHPQQSFAAAELSKKNKQQKGLTAPSHPTGMSSTYLGHDVTALFAVGAVLVCG